MLLTCFTLSWLVIVTLFSFPKYTYEKDVFYRDDNDEFIFAGSGDETSTSEDVQTSPDNCPDRLGAKDLVNCPTDVPSDIECKKFILRHNDSLTKQKPGGKIVPELEEALGIYEYIGTMNMVDKGQYGQVYLSINSKPHLIFNDPSRGWQGTGVRNDSRWDDLRGYKELTLFYTNQDVPQADKCYREKSIDDCTDWKTKRAIDGSVVSDKGLSIECETKMKTVGDWTNEGKCEQVNETCADGMGRQMQKRTCDPGNIDNCTDLDKQQTITCNPDCPSKAADMTSKAPIPGPGNETQDNSVSAKATVAPTIAATTGKANGNGVAKTTEGENQEDGTAKGEGRANCGQQLLLLLLSLIFSMKQKMMETYI